MDQPNEVHLSNRSIFKLIFGFIFILVLAGSIYLIYDKFFTSNALLDIKVEAKENQILPGEKLPFHVELTNLGTIDRFDATLTYRVLTMQGQIIATKQETLAVSTSMAVDREITLPVRIQLGKYQLKALVSYGKNQAASALFSFEVVSERSQPVQSAVSDKTSATEPAKPSTPEPVDQKFQAFLQRIEDTATSNPSAAQNACEQEANPAQYDDCLRVVVKTSRRAEFCDPIKDDNIRDNCYLSFIIEGNSALCGKIVLESNKDYCNRIRDIDLLSKYYENKPQA